MRTHRKFYAAAAAFLLLPAFAKSAEPPPPADDDFLEFLGSADSDDPQFNEYMASSEADQALDADKNSSATPATEKPQASKVKSDES